MENREYIYVVFIKALTGLGVIGRWLTGYEYTHIAVCLDPKLTDFITFSRRKHNAPFDAGFMHETRDCYAFGKHDKVKVKVCKIPVAPANMCTIREYITQIERDSEYVFNLYSMITMPIVHGFPLYKSHNCMSFVSRILELSEVVKLTKPYYRYSIPDIDELLADYRCGEYQLRKKEVENPTYMGEVGIGSNIHSFLHLNVQLIARIFKNTKGR